MIVQKNKEKLGRTLFCASVILAVAVGILGKIPIGRYYFVPIATIKIIMLEWGIWVFVALFFLKDKWFKSWFIWVLICLVLQNNRYSYCHANTILMYVLFYQVLVDGLDSRKAEAILNGICMIVWVHIIWMVLQYQDVWLVFKYVSKTKGWWIFGVLANANSAGALVALSVPAFLRRKWWVLLPAVLGSIWLTRSIGAGIAAGLGVSIYAVVKFPKWRLWIIALIGGGIAYIAITERSYFIRLVKYRVDAWIRMCKVIKANPIQGLGLGQYRNVFPAIDKIVFKSTQASWFRAHNIYVETAFDQSVIGLGLLAGFVCSNIERYLRKPKTELGFITFVGVVISLVIGLFHFLAQTSSMVIPIIYVAIMVNQTKEVRRC